MAFDVGLVRQKLDRLRGSTVVLDLTSYATEVAATAALESELRDLSDAEIDRRIGSIRRDLRTETDIGRLTPEVFALVREIADREIGLRPYDEQLLAGLAMRDGNIAEMATGEGKTLAAVAPVTLAALRGGGVHVMTFNDYLASRDAAWMGPVYRRFGLSVGVVGEGVSHRDRSEAYRRDITYLTAKEAGFDFLRDQLCLRVEDQVHQHAEFALVDEADSILIDEARIPLVVAGSAAPVHDLSRRMAELARNLVAGDDFDTDEYAHNIFLTERGTAKIERLLECGNLYDPTNLEILAELRNALHARYLLKRDVNYIVRDDRVELVDDFTGRVADKRQWPDGLQAAIEAKEAVHLQDEGRILGSITMQHFLALYPGLAGMTATATSAEEELSEYYGLCIVVIPTHRECIRVDHDDVVFTHREAKDAAVVREIIRVHRSGRPVLVGTASVSESEELASALRSQGLDCAVLNAKNDAVEAEIIARAGAPGALTISTNMAGRGTDIRLGGVDEEHRDEVVALGGLYVIGTNRHESLRIDRQLRGRAGRQGDPGSSRFFISLEDPLIRRYGVKNLITPRFMPAHGDAPVDNAVLRREISRAQRIMEGEAASIRKRLRDYSSLIEGQRASIHAWRQAVLDGTAPADTLRNACAARWHELESRVGSELLDSIERRLTLIMIDRCWSDHLVEVARIRDGIHVVGIVGKDPVAEFVRETGAAFMDLRTTIVEEVIAAFEVIEISREGVDWEREGLVGPASTWTYLVHDTPFGANPMQNLANRAGFALWGSIALGPVLFAWALWQHWQRHKARSSPAPGDHSKDDSTGGDNSS